MLGVHTEKVESGKLLRIKVEYNPESQLIEDVQMHGDFFIYPEEFIDDIEQLLVNLDRKDSEQSISSASQRLIDDENADLIGVTPESIARAFKTALGSAINPPAVNSKA